MQHVVNCLRSGHKMLPAVVCRGWNDDFRRGAPYKINKFFASDYHFSESLRSVPKYFIVTSIDINEIADLSDRSDCFREFDRDAVYRSLTNTPPLGL